MSSKKRADSRSTRPGAPGRDVAMLVRRGWSRRDAESLVAVADAVRRAPQERPGEQRLLSRRVVQALRSDPVAHGVEGYLTHPDLELAWRTLAEWLDGDARVALLRLAAACAGVESVLTSVEEAASMLDEDDLNVLAAARAAEARGQFERAIELLGSVTRPLDDNWRKDLQTLVQCGETLPPAVWGRWICSAALRHCLDVPTGLQTAMHYAAVALEACGATPDEIRDLTLVRAMRDQLVHDVVLFDCQGLAGYLEGPLSPEVKERVPGIESWPDAPLVVVRLVGASPDGRSTLCRDLRTGTEIVVGDEQLAEEHPSGRCFIGRLVQVQDDERAWFAIRPTVLDDLTASRVTAVLGKDLSVDRRLVELYRHVRRPVSA
jgi:hypothetical protein